MSVTTTTHLNFRGDARAALEFYRSVFGGDLVAVTYRDAHSVQHPDEADQIMWGQVTSPDGFRVMAYDVPGQADPAAPSAPTTRRENGTTITSEPFFVSVRGDSVEEVGALWEGLAAGASVVEPFGPAQWAPAFGMLTDRFGVSWAVNGEPIPMES